MFPFELIFSRANSWFRYYRRCSLHVDVWVGPICREAKPRFTHKKIQLRGNRLDHFPGRLNHAALIPNNGPARESRDGRVYTGIPCTTRPPGVRFQCTVVICKTAKLTSQVLLFNKIINYISYRCACLQPADAISSLNRRGTTNSKRFLWWCSRIS